jgi:DNA-binding transcriptional LysR family regulator
MKIKPLPPLKNLVAFEAAARHLSFTLAANEMHVTQGAVSRQVRLLEEVLGHQLFKRETRSLRLTETGTEYYQVVREALLTVSHATADFMEWNGDQQLTIVTTTAIASFWLMPKSVEFQRQYPDLNMRIWATDSLRQLMSKEFDVALAYCKTPPQGLKSTPLFSERIFPVCSPEYLQAHPDFSDPTQLIDMTLIVLDTTEQWVGWSQWLEECDLPSMTKTTKRINVSNYPLAVQAALNGQGVTLAWDTLVDSYLQSGLLVKAVDKELATESCFYAIESANPVVNPGVSPFIDWVTQQTEMNNQREENQFHDNAI